MSFNRLISGILIRGFTPSVGTDFYPPDAAGSLSQRRQKRISGRAATQAGSSTAQPKQKGNWERASYQENLVRNDVFSSPML